MCYFLFWFVYIWCWIEILLTWECRPTLWKGRDDVSRKKKYFRNFNHVHIFESCNLAAFLNRSPSKIWTRSLQVTLQGVSRGSDLRWGQFLQCSWEGGELYGLNSEPPFFSPPSFGCEYWIYYSVLLAFNHRGQLYSPVATLGKMWPGLGFIFF